MNSICSGSASRTGSIKTTFQLDAAALAHDHLDLVLTAGHFLPMFYLNDQAILQADNMFRRWRVPAKTLLKLDRIPLRIVFHSAVEKMIPYVKTLPYILPSISTHNYGTKRTSRPPLTPAKLRITTAGIGDHAS